MQRNQRFENEAMRASSERTEHETKTLDAYTLSSTHFDGLRELSNVNFSGGSTNTYARTAYGL